MEIVDTLQINTFGLSPKADVSPSEDPIFVLTAGQIREIFSRAIQPLQEELSELKTTVASQDEKIATLTATQDTQADNQLIQLRLINQLREAKAKEPGKTETARAEKIEKYLASRPDHRATFEMLKGMLQVDNDLLGLAIRSLLPSGKYAIIKTPGDKRKRTLVMLQR